VGDNLLIDLGKWNYMHHKYMLGVYSHLVLIVVGYIASLFFKKQENIEHLTYYDWTREKRNTKQKQLIDSEL
jgi:SSS family solute:Na+ symporter